MKLEKINVTVSSEAKSVLVAFKNRNDCPNLDSALEAFLLKHPEKRVSTDEPH